MGQTHSTGRNNTRRAGGPTASVIKGTTLSCDLTDIKAFCEHTGAKEGEGAGQKAGEAGRPAPAKGAEGAAPKLAQPAPPPKPVEAGHPGGGQRLAKEVEGGPPLKPGQPAPKSGQPAPKPGQPAPKPGQAPPRPLMLQVVPANAQGVKGEVEAHHVKITHGLTKGDKVTLVATVEGSANKCPKWTITDLGVGQTGTSETLTGKQVTSTFLSPPVPLRGAKPFLSMLWLEGVTPRRYQVKCEATKIAPTAHCLLEVLVYPSDVSTLTLGTKFSKHPTNPWEHKLGLVRKTLEGAFDHLATLIPNVKSAKLEILEGELKLSNNWEEEGGSNLAHWKAEAEAELTILSLSVQIDFTEFSFFKKLEDAAQKYERFFEKVTGGVDVQAGLYLTPKGTISLKGKGTYEKDRPPHPESLSISGKLELSLGAEINLKYKGNELATLQVSGSTALTLTGTPQLERGPALWLENKLTWEPLKLHMEATLKPKLSGQKQTNVKGQLTKPQIKKDAKDAEDSGLSVHFDKVILAELHANLLSVDLLSGQTRPAK